METLPKELQDWGLVGGLVMGMFLLVRQLMLWMQGRIDAKDEQLREQHEKVLETATNVISLADKTAAAMVAATKAAENTARVIEGMGESAKIGMTGVQQGLTEICVRLESVEERVGKG